ncbi:VWA domain-containing protein [Streptomyces sp. SBST2-5]|uniref:VWA domain-containing protein n=1 Tax=Streptomyces composti TaxID=2720025 RepID=A0ABX1A824_9ACTN|nr:VWA domain-containing protein [Streptomyces composti]NJP51127.1 VWA domain-containing protein [Streptomyces composti]
MGILTYLRNAFGRSRKARSTEAEAAAQSAAPRTTGSETESPAAPQVPSPATEPTPPTASVPEPREEHELVAAAFDKATVPSQPRTPRSEPAVTEEAATEREPEAEAAAAEKAGSEPAPEAGPKSVEEAEPQATATASTETEATTGTAGKAEPEPEATTGTAAKAEPEPGAAAQAAPEAAGTAESATTAEPGAAPKAAAETPKATKGEATPKPDAGTAEEADAEAATGADGKAERESAAAPAQTPTDTPEAAEPEAKAQPEPEAEPKAKAAPEAEPVAAAADGERAAADSAPRTGGADGKTPGIPAALTTAYTAAAQALADANLTDARARVYLVLDRSASMRPYYKDGSAQALAEQTLALAAHLNPDTAPGDGDGPVVKVVFFSTEHDGTGELTLTDFENKIDTLHAGLGRMGRTSYHAAVQEVLALHDKTRAPKKTPALVIFQTDGAPDAKTPATQALTEAAKTHPSVFFSFVAFGDPENKAFDYLRKLKTPNTACFLAGATPRELTDKELYDGVLASWRP